MKYLEIFYNIFSYNIYIQADVGLLATALSSGVDRFSINGFNNNGKMVILLSTKFRFDTR